MGLYGPVLSFLIHAAPGLLFFGLGSFVVYQLLGNSRRQYASLLLTRNGQLQHGVNNNKNYPASSSNGGHATTEEPLLICLADVWGFDRNWSNTKNLRVAGTITMIFSTVGLVIVPVVAYLFRHNPFDVHYITHEVMSLILLMVGVTMHMESRHRLPRHTQRAVYALSLTLTRTLLESHTQMKTNAGDIRFHEYLMPILDWTSLMFILSLVFSLCKDTDAPFSLLLNLSDLGACSALVLLGMWLFTSGVNVLVLEQGHQGLQPTVVDVLFCVETLTISLVEMLLLASARQQLAEDPHQRANIQQSEKPCECVSFDDNDSIASSHTPHGTMA